MLVFSAEDSTEEDITYEDSSYEDLLGEPLSGHDRPFKQASLQVKQLTNTAVANTAVTARPAAAARESGVGNLWVENVGAASSADDGSDVFDLNIEPWQSQSIIAASAQAQAAMGTNSRSLHTSTDGTSTDGGSSRGSSNRFSSNRFSSNRFSSNRSSSNRSSSNRSSSRSPGSPSPAANTASVRARTRFSFAHGHRASHGILHRAARWCANEGLMGGFVVVQLLCVVALIAVFFALHCTPILDLMSGVADTRGYLGIGTVVEVAVGVLCTIVLLETAFILYSITCGYSGRRRGIMSENRSKVGGAHNKQRIGRAWALYEATFGVAGAYFLPLEFTREVKRKGEEERKRGREEARKRRSEEERKRGREEERKRSDVGRAIHVLSYVLHWSQTSFLMHGCVCLSSCSNQGTGDDATVHVA